MLKEIAKEKLSEVVKAIVPIVAIVLMAPASQKRGNFI